MVKSLILMRAFRMKAASSAAPKAVTLHLSNG